MLRCTICAGPIIQRGRGKVPQFCDECRRNRKRARTNAWHVANPEKVRIHKGREPELVVRRCQECDSVLPRPTPHSAKVYCDDCASVRAAERRKLNDLRLRCRRYGITVEFYNELLIRQGGRCAVCRRDEWGPKSACIDHDHVTGRVRGLLCASCNYAIGHLLDDPDVIRRAASYVEKNRAEPFDERRFVPSFDVLGVSELHV